MQGYIANVSLFKHYFMKESTTARWRRVNRSRFNSDAEFNRWQANRKRAYRAKYRRKLQDELFRNKLHSRLKRKKPDQALLAMIQKIAMTKQAAP